MSQKKNAMTVIILLVGVSLLFSNLSRQETARELFEKAIYLEETKGDLEKAIAVYDRIIEEFPDEREIAAQALLHLGYCYEILGLKDAQKAYQTLIDKYPEQQDAVKTAKKKLSLLQQAQTVLEKDAKAFNVRKVWDNTVDSFFLGKPSPDGRYLSYVDWENFGNLGVRDLVEGENHLLTENDSWETGEMALSGVFSPDGSQIAYCWQKAEGFGELRVMKLDGSQTHILYGDENCAWPWPLAWSPDGKHILAFLHTMGQPNHIAFISVADKSVRVIKTLDPCPPNIVMRMSLSPNGRHIAYSYIQDENSAKNDIFIMSDDGSHHLPLVEHPADDIVIGWTPDGKGLLFQSDRTGSMGIWFTQVDDGKIEGAPQLLRAEMGNFGQLGLTRDGSFFFGLNSGWSDIYSARIDPETGEIKSKPVKIIQQFEGFNSAPDCSPDGEVMVCRSSRRGLGSALLFLSFSTGEVWEVVPKLAISLNFHYIRWSPDGKSILGVGSYKDGYGYLFAIDSRTGDVAILAEPDPKKGIIHRPDWTPDGQAVLYYRMANKAYTIVKFDLKKGKEEEIYRTTKDDVFGLARSPDGKHLAFSSGNKLMVVSLGGGEPKELTPAKETRTIAWTPDSKYILYGLNRDKGDIVDLWRIPADGGEPQKLDLSMPQLMHVDIHPDGQRIVFTAQSRPPKAEVWVMENFLPREEKKN